MTNGCGQEQEKKREKKKKKQTSETLDLANLRELDKLRPPSQVLVLTTPKTQEADPSSSTAKFNKVMIKGDT